MNSKDNSKKQEQIQEYSEQEQTEATQEPVKKKPKFEIKKEDMVSITYDF